MTIYFCLRFNCKGALPLRCYICRGFTWHLMNLCALLWPEVANIQLTINYRFSKKLSLVFIKHEKRTRVFHLCSLPTSSSSSTFYIFRTFLELFGTSVSGQSFIPTRKGFQTCVIHTSADMAHALSVIAGTPRRSENNVGPIVQFPKSYPYVYIRLDRVNV